MPRGGGWQARYYNAVTTEHWDYINNQERKSIKISKQNPSCPRREKNTPNGDKGEEIAAKTNSNNNKRPMSREGLC